MNLNDTVDDLDYDEIYARGGAHGGHEEFDLVKCPHCGWIYMLECEASAIYVNPDDLDERGTIRPFECINCGGRFPEGAWVGPKATVDMTVSWEELKRSPWHWAAPESVYSLVDWPPKPPRPVSAEKTSAADADSCEMHIESGHGISFPGYLHESILVSALRQKRETGSYPKVDKDLRKRLDLAFQSTCISDAVQELSKGIEKWRNQSFTVEDPVKVARIKQTDGIAEPEMNFDPKIGDARANIEAATRAMFLGIKGFLSRGARMAGVEIVGPLEPLYVWCLNVAIRLIEHDVPAETFEQFISSYIEDLYGSNSIEIVKLACTLPQKLPPDADTSFLSYDFAHLARLLEEIARTGTGRFGSYGEKNLVPVFNDMAQRMYKVALGTVLPSRDEGLVREIFSLYHGKTVFPKSSQKLENARYYASMLGCRGQLDEANLHYDECWKFSKMPEFAEQVNPVWSTKFLSCRAETATDQGDDSKAREYLEAAGEEASKLTLSLKENNLAAAEAICLYAHELLRIKEYALSEQNFLAAQKVFINQNAPFWCEHTAICLAELARANGDLSRARTEMDRVIALLSSWLHPREPYWLIANNYRARIAADHGDVAQAKDLYERCCELKCSMYGAIDATKRLLEEYADFLEKNKLEEDAMVVRKRIETLFARNA